jgi:hypothetical protein
MTAYKPRRNRRSGKRGKLGSSEVDPRAPHEKERSSSASKRGAPLEGKAAKNHLGKRARGGSLKRRDLGGSLTSNTPEPLGSPYVTATVPRISGYVPAVSGANTSAGRGPPPAPNAPPPDNPMSDALNLVGTVGSLKKLFRGKDDSNNNSNGDGDGHRRGGRVQR